MQDRYILTTFDIALTSTPAPSFRVRAIRDRFGIMGDEISERFIGDIDLSDDWKIGMICGPSGSGKTTIARELFGDAVVPGFDYGASAVVDDMPSGVDCDRIARTFNAVGFSSPPCWLRPYRVLSGGEKMRVDLSRALLLSAPIIVFDEFTSVVDRQVARYGSAAVAKAVRRSDAQFVAVTCHYDVAEWLCPDWIFDTATMRQSKPKKKSAPRSAFGSSESVGNLSATTGAVLADTII